MTNDERRMSQGLADAGLDTPENRLADQRMRLEMDIYALGGSLQAVHSLLANSQTGDVRGEDLSLLILVLAEKAEAIGDRASELLGG